MHLIHGKNLVFDKAHFKIELCGSFCDGHTVPDDEYLNQLGRYKAKLEDAVYEWKIIIWYKDWILSAQQPFIRSWKDFEGMIFTDITGYLIPPNYRVIKSKLEFVERIGKTYKIRLQGVGKQINQDAANIESSEEFSFCLEDIITIQFDIACYDNPFWIKYDSISKKHLNDYHLNICEFEIKEDTSTPLSATFHYEMQPKLFHSESSVLLNDIEYKIDNASLSCKFIDKEMNQRKKQKSVSELLWKIDIQMAHDPTTSPCPYLYFYFSFPKKECCPLNLHQLNSWKNLCRQTFFFEHTQECNRNFFGVCYINEQEHPITSGKIEFLSRTNNRYRIKWSGFVSMGEGQEELPFFFEGEAEYIGLLALFDIPKHIWEDYWEQQDEDFEYFKYYWEQQDEDFVFYYEAIHRKNWESDSNEYISLYFVRGFDEYQLKDLLDLKEYKLDAIYYNYGDNINNVIRLIPRI